LDPVTHALASLLLARAGQKRLPRRGYAMLLAAGVAPDLDSLSYFFGASAYLRIHQTLLHSLVSSVALACVLAIAFVALDRNRIRHQHAEGTASIRFAPAFIVCAAAIAFHLLLDAATDIGFQPLWPFRRRWIALDLVPHFEIWIALLLGAALAIPELFNMVREEIGDHEKAPRGIAAAVVGLALLFAYIGARGILHSRAMTLLGAREYQELAPLAVGVFPTASPFTWRGVVSTERALEEVEIPFLPGETFDPDRAVVHNKPDDSPALATAQNAGAARAFLAFARFPLASVDATDLASRIRFRDLRFESNDKSPDNIGVQISVGSGMQVADQAIYFNARGPAE
jgi:membrane-bound metal-dependent hydrolase YbcI (DUF457 family)